MLGKFSTSNFIIYRTLIRILRVTADRIVKPLQQLQSLMCRAQTKIITTPLALSLWTVKVDWPRVFLQTDRSSRFPVASATRQSAGLAHMPTVKSELRLLPETEMSSCDFYPGSCQSSFFHKHLFNHFWFH